MEGLVDLVQEYRRYGLGRRLFQEMAGFAKVTGCTRLQWVVLDWNEMAINFYKSLGVTVCDEWRICQGGEQCVQSLASNATLYV